MQGREPAWVQCPGESGETPGSGMPPKGSPKIPTLSDGELLKLEDDMIQAYKDPAFQRRLRDAWDAAGGDYRLQVKARQEVCLPAQLSVITKYGFEASMRGVNHSVSMYTKRNAQPEFGIRGETLNWLVNPSLQRAPRQVDILIGANQYSLIEVFNDYTVGSWKQQMETGLLGTKVLYARSLVCHNEKLPDALQDDDMVPGPPSRLCIAKPAAVVKMLELALKSKLGEPSWCPRMGDFRVIHSIGKGAAGICVYKATYIYNYHEVAIKWPAKPEEAHALREIHKRLPEGCLGFPQLMAFGSYEEKQYLVLPLLRSTLAADFPRLQALAPEKRWQLVAAIGRVFLQRLRALHVCGYVHCDVSPENALHGSHNDRNTLFLIDFGLSRRFPGGRPLRGDFGSAEWSSIRSAEGRERRPEDDLEALGWVLLHCLVGEPPWVRMLKAAYPEWSSLEKRESTIKKVQQSKLQVLNSEWEQLGGEWEIFADVPEDLFSYLHASRTEVVPPSLPNYELLGKFLGAPEGCDPMEAENTFEMAVLPVLRHGLGQ